MEVFVEWISVSSFEAIQLPVQEVLDFQLFPWNVARFSNRNLKNVAELMFPN